MAVAHDFASESHTGATGSASEAQFTWSHNPGVAPRGVLIFVVNVVSQTEQVTSVTYDGVAVPAVSGGAAQDTAGEPGRCTAFFLGSGIPTTDPADVVVNRNNNTDELWAVAITVNAASDTEVYLPGIVLVQGDGTYAEQSVTDNSPGSNSVRYAGTHSGINTPPPAGGSSTALHSFDTGNQTAAVVRETTAGQGARNVGFSSASSEDRAGVHLAVRETTTQQLAGALFTKAPTFFTGAITTTYTLSGVLFAKSPSFFTGTVLSQYTLSGILFTKAPVFFVGALTTQNTLSGVLFAEAPTFPTGAITTTYTLGGALFAEAPTFPTGAITQAFTLSGVLFAEAPTFFTGTVTTGAVTLSGVLFAAAPSFFVGSVTTTVTLSGVLFSKAPTFPVGAVTTSYFLSGALFAQAPSFFVGAVTTQVTLSGVLFAKAPTFPTGIITTGAVTLSGVFFSKTPSFFVGAITQPAGGLVLDGVLFSLAPGFFTGAIALALVITPPFGATISNGGRGARIANGSRHARISDHDRSLVLR